MKKSEKCPICGGAIPNALHEGEYAGALSRVDNETEICSECGFMEAMQGFYKNIEAAEIAVEIADATIYPFIRRTSIKES